MSTVVLFSQPQYQDPYIFNGKLIKGILDYIVSAQHRFTSELSTSVLNSSLSSAVSPPPLSVFLLIHMFVIRILRCSVNSTLTSLHLIIFKHLAYEVMITDSQACELVQVVHVMWCSAFCGVFFKLTVDLMKHFSLLLVLRIPRV